MVIIYLFQIIMIRRILKFYREVTILKNTLTVLLLERKWICMKREIKYNSYSKTPAKNVKCPKTKMLHIGVLSLAGNQA